MSPKVYIDDDFIDLNMCLFIFFGGADMCTAIEVELRFRKKGICRAYISILTKLSATFIVETIYRVSNTSPGVHISVYMFWLNVLANNMKLLQ